MHFSLVLVCLCVVGTFAQDRVYTKQNTAIVNEGRKSIDAQFAGNADAKAESVQMVALRDSVNMMLKDRDQRLRAQMSGKQAVAGKDADQVKAGMTSDTDVEALSAKGEKVAAGRVGDNGVQAQGAQNNKVAASSQGDRAMAVQGRQRANVARTREGEVVSGGTAAQGANNAQLKNMTINGQKVARMEANRQFNADAAAVGTDQWNVKTANAKDAESRGQYAAKSQTLTQEAGDGVVNAKNKKGQAAYNYKFVQNGEQGDVSLDQVGTGTGAFSRRTTGWKCVAVKDGESTCLDVNGKVVGKVMTNARGDATVVDNNGVVVGRGKVNKIDDEKYEVVVSDGLVLAKTEELKEYDCYSEVIPGGSQDKKVIIENVKATVDGVPVGPDGAKSFSWPTCFDIEADVTIPEGVDPSKLAFEYLGHVMPMGNMKCMDSMTCGRGCYYCNACDKERLLNDDLKLQTGDTNAVCDIHGGSGKQRVSMRVCPPEEVEKNSFCGGFDRHLVGNDYYKYDGAINAQIRVWLRPENEVTLRKNFFAQSAVPVVKQGLVNAYKIEKLTVVAPTDNELLEWYVRKNGEEQLLACRRGVIDYNVGGSNINSNIMIDAFANAGKNVQLFSDAPCDDWVAQQKKEYEAYEKENQASESTGASSSSLSSLLQKFSRGGRL